MSRRLVLIFIPLLALQLSPSILRASQNAQEVKKARLNPDTATQSDPQIKDQASPTSNPSPSARPSQPDSTKNPDPARPAISDKNGASAPKPAEAPGNTPSALAGTATLKIRNEFLGSFTDAR